MSQSPRTDQMDARILPSEVGDLPEYIYQHIRPILGEWSALCRDIETKSTIVADLSARWQQLAEENLAARGTDAVRFLKEIAALKAKCDVKQPVYYGDISPQPSLAGRDFTIDIQVTCDERRTATGPRRLVYIEANFGVKPPVGGKWKRGACYKPGAIPEGLGRLKPSAVGRRAGDYEAWQALSTKCPTFIANVKTVIPTKGASFEDFAAPGACVFSDRRRGVVSRRQFKMGDGRPRRREIKVQENNGRGRRSTDRVPYWDLPLNQRVGVAQRRSGQMWDLQLARRTTFYCGRRLGDTPWLEMPFIERRATFNRREPGCTNADQQQSWAKAAGAKPLFCGSFLVRYTKGSWAFVMRGLDRRKS